MNIRNAVIEDIDRLMDIYAHGKEIQCKTGNPTQWLDGYPKKELIEKDILNGICYVVEEDNNIIGVFAFIEGDDPTYKVITDGKWLNDRPYGTIHRIASSGEKKGVFDECVKWCFEKCGNLRIDTHENNKIMQKLIIRNGFEYCGQIRVEDGSPRMAYEKIK
ncbi:MAG: N-acetyltransferase [Clostridium sp.]|uniref:GNAT family N-acetyltransferase n=1 Tax=Clostridium sp. TaxID=1506 RepID=UPI002A8F5477|nr:N-acetyltransferase [Clostridium sp.]MDY5096681.1 N-acetyltransferase [Clostridium sp.]